LSVDWRYLGASARSPQKASAAWEQQPQCHRRTAVDDPTLATTLVLLGDVCQSLLIGQWCQPPAERVGAMKTARVKSVGCVS
jgi:hypothetical protein